MRQDDLSALDGLKDAGSDRSKPHFVRHYLYFPEKKMATKAVDALKAMGFEIEFRLGADGVNWLVLALHEIIPTDKAMSDVRIQMDRLASSLRGEYDGWEAGVE